MSRRIMIFTLAAVFSGGLPAFAQPKADPPKLSKEQEADVKLLKKVYEKLLAVSEPVEGYEWPPDIAIVYEQIPNAYAQLITGDDRKQRPILRFYDFLMRKIIGGDEDRLAFIMGHELGHVLKKHISAKPANKIATPLLKDMFTRQQEEEADAVAIELMAKAGFSIQKGLKAPQRFQDLGLEYSSFEGLGSDHPSWNDRLKKVDKDRAGVWKVCSAFTNGVFYLTTEQYLRASACFEFVTKEFPGVHEAWANLGYAYLMQYCDQLSKADIEGYGLGQIIVGGFYTRAGGLRIKDIKMWNNAIGALNESNRLKQGQTLVLANLGLAYLVHPDGKDVGKATGFLNDAIAAARDDKDLDPVAHAALMVNLGVANLANAEPEKAMAQIDETEKAVKTVADKYRGRTVPNYAAALKFNKALVLAGRKDKADREKAAEILEDYLQTTSSLTLWWEVAHGKYEKLCPDIGRVAKTAEALKKVRTVPARLVTGVKLKSGVEVTLGDDREEVEKKLGEGSRVQVIRSQNLWRTRYEKLGVEILGNDDVLAIGLFSSEAPVVPIMAAGLGSEKLGDLKVGMAIDDVEKILGEVYQPCEITTADVFYRYYRDQGVALRVQKGKVTEVVIVQVPKQRAVAP